MKTQKTLRKQALQISEDLDNRVLGKHLRDIYHYYSDAKLHHFNRCFNSIQNGAHNLHFGVYPCGSWSFVFLASYDIEVVDNAGDKHLVTVFKRFTRDTTTCILYVADHNRYYEAYSYNSYFDLGTSDTEHVILHIIDGLEN